MRVMEELFEGLRQTGASGYAVRALAALAIGAFGWTIARWARRAIRRFGERSQRLDPTLMPVIATAVRWAILAVTLVAVLDGIGVQTSSVIAFLGAAGLAVGLALKETLGDVASGLVLLVRRPFDVGDAVAIADTGGTVEALDLFETRLTGFDGVPVVVPNGRVRASDIKNYSRANTRRIEMFVRIGYDDDAQQAAAILRRLLAADARLLGEPAPLVNTHELTESAVLLLVRAWTAPDDYLAAQMDLTGRIKDELQRAGISNPAPPRAIRIVSDTRAA